MPRSVLNAAESIQANGPSITTATAISATYVAMRPTTLRAGVTGDEDLAVASCGLLPRATRPGPRVRTAFVTVANPHPREMKVPSGRSALVVAPRASRQREAS